jgi:hypothetical protein
MMPLWLDWLLALNRALMAPWLTVLPPGCYPPRHAREPGPEPAPVERMKPRLRLIINKERATTGGAGSDAT